MVLDEDALEAMLKRQQAAGDDADSKESKQVELTQQTEEFEVYEREPGTQKTGAGLRAASSKGPSPNVFPDAFQDDDAEIITNEPEPTPEPEPVVEDVPEPEVAAEPEPVVETTAEPELERPRVWPPLSRSAPEPEPEPEPEVQAASEPEPELEPEPVVEAPIQETYDDNPHAHAHAKLDVNGGGVRVAIVQALFNQDITDMMADLAVAKAKKRGAEVAHHVTVPGVYDLPLVTAHLLERDDVDCAVVIGVVVQGETKHDDLITFATAQTLQKLSLDVDKPIGLGITGPGMTWKQAEARVANGAHALDAALAQLDAIKAIA